MNKKFTVPVNETLFPVKYKKKQANFTIKEDVLNDFNKFAEDNRYNKSGVIEQLLISFLVSHGVRKE